MGYRAPEEERVPPYLFMQRGDSLEVGRAGTDALALFRVDRSTGTSRIVLSRVVEVAVFVPDPDVPDRPDMRRNVGPRQSLSFSVEGLASDQVTEMAMQFGAMVLDVVDAHVAKREMEELFPLS